MKSKNYLLPLFINLFVLFLVSVNLQGQSIRGTWYGVNETGFNARQVMHIDSTQLGLQVRFDALYGASPANQVTGFSFVYPQVRLETKGFIYEGSVDANCRKITGFRKVLGSWEKLDFVRDSLPRVESDITSIQTRYNKREVMITMRDGIKLFTSIYTPKDTSETHPMLMVRTPYCSERGGKDRFNSYLSSHYWFIKEKYIMVFQDVRGRYMSEGKFEDIRPFIADKKSSKDIDEASDTYDTADWLVKNVRHNNGRMGVMGVSYPGFYSTMAILSGHPAIRAVSPQAPVTAWFTGDDVHHNGAFFLLDNFSFDFSNERTFTKPSRTGFPGFRMPVNDNYQFFLEQGALKNITAKYFGDSIKIWNDGIKHPNYDNFWKARNPVQFLKNVGPAVMTVGGWFDAEDLFGTLQTYQAIEKQNDRSHPNYLVMGPWSHGQWSAGTAENLGNIYWGQDANQSFQELELNFFNFYLKDKGKEEFPEATVFVTGANQWKSFNTWPPANVTDLKLYFQPAGKLSMTPPVTTESFDEYVSDPMKPVPYSEKINTRRTREYMDDDQRFVSRRPDVMVYQTDSLKEDLTLTGPLTADLFVSTSGTDADFVVKLIDVFPQNMPAPENKVLDAKLGGYQMLVRAEVFRGRYRKSFENPEPFIPGEMTEIKYELPDVAHSFKKGHRIMIQVQNSWFPLVDRNPQKFVDIYRCSDTDFQKATQRIYHDRQHASGIQAKVLQ